MGEVARYASTSAVTSEEVRDGRWQLLMHPDDGPRYVEAFVAAVRNRGSFHSAVRVRRRDGAWRGIESCGRARFNAANDSSLVGASSGIGAYRRALVTPHSAQRGRG